MKESKKIVCKRPEHKKVLILIQQNSTFFDNKKTYNKIGDYYVDF